MNDIARLQKSCHTVRLIGLGMTAFTINDGDQLLECLHSSDIIHLVIS